MQLDQIISVDNSATQQEIDEAVEYQCVCGGRLESHLFRFGYVGEVGLVKALSKLSSKPGICLSGIEIHENALSVIPAEVAWRQMILPVSYDAERKTLILACEDPERPGLAEALAKVCPEATIDLRIALSDLLKSCLAKYYRRPPANLRDAGSGEIEPSVEQAATGLAPAHGSAYSLGSERCRIVLFDATDGGGQSIAQMLSHQSYQVAVVCTPDGILPEIQQRSAEALILVMSGGRDDAMGVLEYLSSHGLSISNFPAYLVLPSFSPGDESELLKAGFEDVISSDNVLDFLMIKLSRLRERLQSERSRQLEIMQTLGTHGSLTDMNVIDLLQSMGQTGKTARISVSAHGQQLTVYLDRGRIVYAECDDIRGPEAVYCALGWRQGVWSVDPVAAEELPEPNNNLATEAVLLDGCRRLDEMKRQDNSEQIQGADQLAVFNGLS